jgi:ABC-2 type transport system permease protein
VKPPAGVILRYGLGAEELAGSLAFLLLPPCSVYYPVSVLPDSLQVIALALPTTHVFEDALQRAGERHAGAIG